MMFITLLHSQLKLKVPDKLVLSKMVVEMNKFLPDEQQLSVDDPPTAIEMVSLLTFMNDADKLKLYNVTLNVEVGKVNVLEQLALLRSGKIKEEKQALPETDRRKTFNVIFLTASLFVAIFAMIADVDLFTKENLMLLLEIANYLKEQP